MMIVNIFSRENFIFWSADFAWIFFLLRSVECVLLWRYYGVGFGGVCWLLMNS